MFKHLTKFLMALFLLGGVFSCVQDDLSFQDDSFLEGDLIQTAASEPIEGKYIVVFNTAKTGGEAASRFGKDYAKATEFVRDQAIEILESKNVRSKAIEKVYSMVLDGFAGELTLEEVEALRNDERIAYIEQDATVHINATTQNNPTWGLDRVDQRNLPLDSKYVYDANGSGVTAYIIDSGIRTSHNEFGNRAQQGFDAFGGNSEDCNGHGTHVAGTLGGTVYGVAKGVNLVAVRVLDCNGSGSFSGVINGMDWVAANASGPSVANMSLGGGSSTAVNDAVARMFDAGVPVIVAAGNGNRGGKEQDACGYSPAGAPKAYTVGATTTNDSKTSWSNYGNCVDIFAPGASITSAWHTSNTATNTISGTSMAAPHVAGAAALFLAGNFNASSQQVYDFLTANSTKNIVNNSKTTNNHMLYTRLGEGGGDDGGGDGGGGDDGGGDNDGSDITLSANAYKVSGIQRVDLTWSGATTSNVDIYRDGTKIATVSNSGSYTDNLNRRGGGSYVYQVCEAGSTTCSNQVTASF